MHPAAGLLSGLRMAPQAAATGKVDAGLERHWGPTEEVQAWVQRLEVTRLPNSEQTWRLASLRQKENEGRGSSEWPPLPPYASFDLSPFSLNIYARRRLRRPQVGSWEHQARGLACSRPLMKACFSCLTLSCPRLATAKAGGGGGKRKLEKGGAARRASMRTLKPPSAPRN